MKQDIQTDSIHLRGLRLKCWIGVSAAECSKKQIIMADIALQRDLRKAGKSDCLEDTLDYSVIVKKLSALAASKKFCLLEALAERMAEICLAESKVKAVTVKVAKKGILSNVSSVEIEISRKTQIII